MNKITEIDKELQVTRCFKCKREAEVKGYIYSERVIHAWCLECWYKNKGYNDNRFYIKINDRFFNILSLIKSRHQLDNDFFISSSFIFCYIVGIATIRHGRIKIRIMHPFVLFFSFVAILADLICKNIDKEYFQNVKNDLYNYAVLI